jgi:hypothetical protein
MSDLSLFSGDILCGEETHSLKILAESGGTDLKNYEKLTT